MFVLESYPWAVVFCVITMLCWGSWANTQKLAKKGWRFELFYWDYTIGVLVLRIFGEPSLFGGRSFTPMAQEACGFGMPCTSIRHMRQLPAIDKRS